MGHKKTWICLGGGMVKGSIAAPLARGQIGKNMEKQRWKISCLDAEPKKHHPHHLLGGGWLSVEGIRNHLHLSWPVGWEAGDTNDINRNREKNTNLGMLDEARWFQPHSLDCYKQPSKSWNGKGPNTIEMRENLSIIQPDIEIRVKHKTRKQDHVLPNPLVQGFLPSIYRVERFFSAPTIFDNEAGHWKCRTTNFGHGHVEDLDFRGMFKWWPPRPSLTRQETINAYIYIYILYDNYEAKCQVWCLLGGSRYRLKTPKDWQEAWTVTGVSMAAGVLLRSA